MNMPIEVQYKLYPAKSRSPVANALQKPATYFRVATNTVVMWDDMDRSQCVVCELEDIDAVITILQTIKRTAGTIDAPE